MIDAYARAVALAGTDAQFATQKPLWLESLTTWYKYRNNNSDTGMTEFIAGVLAKPLPPEPSPITVLPASTPAASPAQQARLQHNGNGAATHNRSGGNNSPANKTATPATGTPANRRNPAPSPFDQAAHRPRQSSG